MSQAAALLAAAQSFHAEQFPATISLGAQSYAAATSGLSRSSEMELLGGVALRKIAFWLPAAAFAAAGAPLPREGQSVTCSAPTAHAGTYAIEAVLADPTGTTLTLRCTAPAQ